MKTTNTIPLDSIRPNERNPRKITDDAASKLRDSIRRDPEFMALRPIVIDEVGIIIGGNQRYRACIELGMGEVPSSWIRVARGLTPEQRERFILIDNAPEGMSGDWDIDALLADFEAPDLHDLGFDDIIAGLQIEDEIGEYRTGVSPWARVGAASEGVLFSFGDIQCRLSEDCYRAFASACPDTDLASWLEGFLREGTNR
jgi:hypothetical protein